ncbi:MAG TPA: DUF3467 domain-containing protein [Candidatus Angelobacter sp.]
MVENSATDDLDESREGRYANHFYVGHNAFEVILQFGQFYEGNSKPVMHTKIVTSPAYAEIFLQLLSRSITEYKSTFGATGRPHE